MAMLFTPTGTLDVSTEAAQLPETGSQGLSASGALTRAKNVTLNRQGRADTRHGSTQVSTATLGERASFLLPVAGVRFAFGQTELYRNEVTIASGLTGGDWSAVSYNSLASTDEELFACNGTERKRIELDGTVAEWGIEPPTLAPTLAAGASTGLTGAYTARYTYLRKSGSTILAESNPSPESDPQSLSDQSLSVTWTASSDSQVTHVRVYRTLADGSIYYVDQDIAVGTTSVDSTTADSALGALLETDRDRPPSGAQLVAGPFYSGVLFVVVGNLLYWSSAKQPEYWPTDQFIEVGEPEFPIKALVEYQGQVYCWTDRGAWYIQGAGSGFNPIPLRVLAGAPNQFSALAVEGHGIYHIGGDGVYLYGGGRDRKMTQDSFEPLWMGEVNGMQEVFNDTSRWLWQFQNRLYFHYRNGSFLVFNLDTQRTSYQKHPVRLTAPATDWLNDYFLCGDNFKELRRLEVPSATDDAGTDIEWEVQSKDFTIQTRRHFPRWVKYDVDGAATGEVLLDDVVHQTHTLTDSRDTRRRLIKTGNARRCAIRVKGTGPKTFYMAEME